MAHRRKTTTWHMPAACCSSPAGSNSRKQMKGLKLLLISLGPGGWGADYQASQKETADLLASIIRINTSNPPGQEAKMAEYLATLFRPLGFEVDIFPTPEAGKSHFMARLRGEGSRKPILLATHADLASVSPDKSPLDPFTAATKV